MATIVVPWARRSMARTISCFEVGLLAARVLGSGVVIRDSFAVLVFANGAVAVALWFRDCFNDFVLLDMFLLVPIGLILASNDSILCCH
jgi:hypothetical protein